jgi:hypothetical protein
MALGISSNTLNFHQNLGSYQVKIHHGTYESWVPNGSLSPEEIVGLTLLPDLDNEEHRAKVTEKVIVQDEDIKVGDARQDPIERQHKKEAAGEHKKEAAGKRFRLQ